MISEGKNIEFAPPTAGFQSAKRRRIFDTINDGESATSILIIWCEIAAHSTSLRVNFCARNDILIDSSAALGITTWAAQSKQEALLALMG